MSKIAAVLATIAMGVVSAGASAQQTFDHEVSFFGNWESISEPADFDTTSVFFRYGKYFSPQLVGTLGVNMTTLEGNGFDSSTTALTLGAKYYFNLPREKNIAPFVEGTIGVASTDAGGNSSSDMTWEIGGGAAWFFTPTTSFDAAFRFFQTDGDVTTEGTRLTVGITTRF
jgi:hypothetical protein